MALEKPLIKSYVFDTDNVFVAYFNDLIHQQERKAMWQFTFYIFQIVYGWFVQIVTGNTRIVPVLFHVMLYLFCKFDIAAMTGAVSNYMCFDGIPDQGKITNYIQ